MGSPTSMRKPCCGEYDEGGFAGVGDGVRYRLEGGDGAFLGGDVVYGYAAVCLGCEAVVEEESRGLWC
jgi:hypothetical protein